VADLDDLFAQLRQMLARHASSLVTVRDEPGDLQMETSRRSGSGTAMPFGAVHTHEDHVSLQFMPVFSHADLLTGVSAPLRARMQGRTCFNFTPATASPELLAELSELVDAGLARYRADRLA